MPQINNLQLIKYWIEFKTKCIENDIIHLEEQIKLFEVWVNLL